MKYYHGIYFERIFDKMKQSQVMSDDVPKGGYLVDRDDVKLPNYIISWSFAIFRMRFCVLILIMN